MKKLYFLILLWIFFPLNVFASDTFLSLKKNKVNVRYGPGFEYPIKYIYKKINLPIKQIDKKENFRRIIDFKNTSFTFKSIFFIKNIFVNFKIIL